jgi:hypothetical protein
MVGNRIWAIVAGAFLLTPGSAWAADSTVPATSTPLQLDAANTPNPAPADRDADLYSDLKGVTNAQGGDFFGDWFAMATQTQDNQPHWMTPLVTVTPRLEQEYRYDQYWENRGNGSQLDIFGAGKGLELIPTETNEVLINPPAYQEKVNVAKPVSGWLDDQFLVVKQRLLTANEENGNYIVTGRMATKGAAKIRFC